MSGRVLIGDHDERGRLYAAFDPQARHVEPGVRASRFSAFLAPYRTQQEAERALIDAGAVIAQ